MEIILSPTLYWLIVRQTLLLRAITMIGYGRESTSSPQIKKLTQYLKLRDFQRKSYTHYFYEATVGSGIPIISTLRGFLETGDKILCIKCICSGTLSYLFNNSVGDQSFSEVVAEAKNAGFTEPDPRDDLSGTNVARKVIILVRESGLTKTPRIFNVCDVFRCENGFLFRNY